MQLHTITPRTKNTKNAPVGRGGKRGKTSGRGGKGQTARAGHKIRPEVRDLIKKFPKRRGYGKNRARTVKTNRVLMSVVNIAVLEASFSAGGIVTPASLFAQSLVRRVKGRMPTVKILGTGELTKALVIKDCVVSKSARVAVTKAGGTVYEEQSRIAHA